MTQLQMRRSYAVYQLDTSKHAPKRDAQIETIRILYQEKYKQVPTEIIIGPVTGATGQIFVKDNEVYIALPTKKEKAASANPHFATGYIAPEGGDG